MGHRDKTEGNICAQKHLETTQTWSRGGAIIWRRRLMLNLYNKAHFWYLCFLQGDFIKKLATIV